MGPGVFDGECDVFDAAVLRDPIPADKFQGAPIAGYLLAAYGGENDSLDSYHPAIFFAGSAALASCLLVGLVRLKSSKKLLVKI